MSTRLFIALPKDCIANKAILRCLVLTTPNLDGGEVTMQPLKGASDLGRA